MNCLLIALFSMTCMIGIIESKENFQPGTFLLDKPECNSKRMQKTDSSVIKWLAMGKGGRKFPTDRDNLKTFCKDTDRYSSDLEKFIDDCYASDQKKVAKIFVFSTKQSLKPICGKKKSKKQQKFLEIGPCLNTIIEDMKCLESYVNKSRNLIPYDIGSDKIKHVCCNFVELIKCVDKELTIPCMDDAGRELLLDLMRNISGDTINFGCGDYTESTDRCDHLEPLPKDKFNKKNKISNRIKSFFFTNIAVIESIADGGDVAPL